MTNSSDNSNLPAQIAQAIGGIPSLLVPSSLKALDRLVGATVEIPVAWLAQKKAQIDAQTKSYSIVEDSIAKSVAAEAGTDPIIVGRALGMLVRKSYRKQANCEQVSLAMVENLQSESKDYDIQSQKEDIPVIDDDWLNVFERYAEDASSERMQKLWGRVLAGEIRKPGHYSLRTLRFLSEFSQADALLFSDFCNSVFHDFAPKALLKIENENKDIRPLISMESAGLLHGASGLGLQVHMVFDKNGQSYIREGGLAIFFYGEPNTRFSTNVISLTPMGQELLALLPDRDPRAAAKLVAESMRNPQIKAAYLTTIIGDQALMPMEILWREDLTPPEAPQ